MRFGSICSGIEAASAALRLCGKCGVSKPLTEFHKHKTGPHGLHCWCRTCCNVAQKVSRAKNGRPPTKARWNLKTRYNLTPDDVHAMRVAQGYVCAICLDPMAREVIDHNHETGQVRGLLCHGCNIKLPAVERAEYREAALAYLARFER